VCAELSGGEAEVQVQLCRTEDLPEIQAILQFSPEAAAWHAESLAAIFAQNRKYFFIASQNHKVSGFIVGRRVLDEAEVLNLGVHPAARRNGTGSALLRVLLEAFRRENVVKVFLEVRESNLPAIAFYQKAGFQQIGIRPKYYRDPNEAALVLGAPL
jgi:[ribosomal protein S18]-alanine N-acetyltransferase